MKKTNRYPVLLIPVLFVFVSIITVNAQRAEFKLKEGAGGQLCLDCHDGLQEQMDKPFVHSPLSEGECIGCHNPHVSSYAMLMSAAPTSVCYTCHDSMVPDNPASVHQVVIEGECGSCHDPHASDYEYNLVNEGPELCYECHEALASRIEENKYEHPPIRESCLGCHDPHASEKGEKLLGEAAPAVCLKCHETDKDSFKRIHRDYPVELADCTSCHDPHGSSTAAMLYDNVHDPVARGNCNRCHVEPASSDPFALNAAGSETCQACHYEMITETLNQSQIHWPVVDKKGCVNCHNPHASPEEKLMRQPMLKLCADCHSDTIARQERAETKHPPIAEGQCSACHMPHGSDNQFILKEESTFDLCADCHDWQTHTTHPIGEEIIDPRNENISVQCESCHRTHGTEYTMFLYYATVNEQCIQCHVEFRR